jgi:hypothetical protein
MPDDHPRVLPIPEGGALLHVGPHKTGSTAIQDALHQARADLALEGVRYASSSRHDGPGVRWLTGRLIPGQDPVRAERMWQQVVEAMRDELFARTVFSSEFLSDATDAHLDTIVGQMGADRLHVVVTLRPLAKILPSQYQQSVHRGMILDYPTWLDVVLRDLDAERSQTFWRRQRHDRLIRRWVERIGVDHVVAIVADSSDFTMVPRSFEQLLDVSPGTLVDRDVMVNRSYTLAELELVRGFHAAGREVGLSVGQRHALMARTSRFVKERVPEKGEPKLSTPDWAIDEANRVGGEIRDYLASSGVRVIGDPAPLAAAGYEAATPDGSVSVPSEVAARFSVGMALAAPQGSDGGDEASNGAFTKQTVRRLLHRFRTSP